MEIIRRASFAAISFIFNIYSFGVSVVLDAVEGICFKCQALTGGDQDNTFNFALAFPNGQHEKIVVDGNPSEEPKRIKLVLDIKMHHDHKFELISARSVNSQWKSKWRPLDKFIETAVYYLLQIIKIIREILGETDRFLEVSRTTVSCNGCHADTENRKKISPRKRVSKSTSRNFRRYVANIKKILGFGQAEGLVFDPIEGVADMSLNGSFNNSKLKAAEKRKQPAYTTSESDCSEDEDPDQSSLETSEELKVNEEEQKDEVSSTDAVTSANNSALEGDATHEDAEAGCESDKQCSKKKNYFEVDEDYKSAEDPDYAPSQHESSSDDSELDEDPQEKLLEEVEELKLDLQNGDTPKNNV